MYINITLGPRLVNKVYIDSVLHVAVTSKDGREPKLLNTQQQVHG